MNVGIGMVNRIMLKFYVYIIWIENSKGTKENKFNKIPKKKKISWRWNGLFFGGDMIPKKKMDHVEMKRLI